MAFNLRLGCEYKIDVDGVIYASGIQSYYGVNAVASSDFDGLLDQELVDDKRYKTFYRVSTAYLKVVHKALPSGWYFKSWKAEVRKASGDSVVQTFTSETNPSGADGSIYTGWDLLSLITSQSGTVNLRIEFTLYVTSVVTYTVSFDLNDGSGSFSSIQTSNGSATLPSETPTRSGYTFLGWSTSSSSTTAEYSAGQTITVSSDIILFAVWQKNTTPPTPGDNDDGSLVYNKDDSLLVFVSDGNLAYY